MSFVTIEGELARWDPPWIERDVVLETSEGAWLELSIDDPDR